ncbi:hypothetical protein KR067_009322, partial [Drosophila pandora]
MVRTILILVLLAWSTGNLADAKPIFIKVFAPNLGHGSNSATSYQSSATTAPINTQFISSLISTKIQLWNSLLQSKSSGGSYGFGFSKSISFSTTTTTEKPTDITHHTTEVNTDFTPDDSSSTTTHNLYTTTTEGSTKTPKPTIHPEPPVPTTSTPVTGSTSSQPEESTTTEASSGYSYQTPTPTI